MAPGVPPISGQTASAIADSVRDLVSRGDLAPGAMLPPIRSLATELRVNRNTVAAAYRQLVSAGVAQAGGRRGTTIAEIPDLGAEQLPGADLVDLASGNPDPLLLPDLPTALRRAPYRPTLYGAPAVEPHLMAVAERLFDGHLAAGEAQIVVTHGAVDAVERVLSTCLARGDAVAVEDPCFLASIGTVRLNGYQRIGVPVDEHGMTVAGLHHAIANGGARAVIVTPRSHNPTGVSIDDRRAAQLRSVLAGYPEVLVIEDDYFSLVSSAPYCRVTPESTFNWALVRSVAKFLGPDLRVAMVATNPQTGQLIGARLRAGKTWVSHLLQATAAHLLTDAATVAQLGRARRTYAKRGRILTEALVNKGISPLGAPDGLNLWIDLPDAETVVATVARLSQAGWAVQPGDIFAIDPYHPRHGIRITSATMTGRAATRFAADFADAVT
ncbi:aminotransferase class I/II-fold pyridoxal phosphate-dependent enzyme [Mycobacterium vicinigordonae]|uniref:Aminotransferase class I/II-fold pyridoxal phosphate-dependent enzyme n=2 Tax=Mycobacterium vicinigordonae TaxID=1719132 RepID=A0A7D6E608_9MYCO|nr:aminotransferase class I/II-fold pyridoxal phosphate-dependent enzyme [Mycobacterium vicinigordonae]